MFKSFEKKKGCVKNSSAMDSFLPLAITAVPNDDGTDIELNCADPLSVASTCKSQTSNPTKCPVSAPMSINSKFEPVRRVSNDSLHFPPKRYYVHFWGSMSIGMLAHSRERMDLS